MNILPILAFLGAIGAASANLEASAGRDNDWPSNWSCDSNCRCPSPRQSLVYRSSAEPPYCQRIYFPGCRKISCPSGFVGACFGVAATYRPHCSRRRPRRCPNGYWLARGTKGRFSCIRVARPRGNNPEKGCASSEYAVCVKVKPAGCKAGEVNEEAEGSELGGEQVDL